MNKLFDPIYLRQLCQQYGLTPSRNYGQHFLIKSEPIEQMIAAAALSKTDTVVEIGPGFGVLTSTLTQGVGKVVAFEIERKLSGYWERMMAEKKWDNLEIVWGNALRSLETDNFGSKPYKVVANLPYQITSNIIRRFLEADHPPQLMVLMVQKEVAERICARPGQMSLLSVAVQYYAQPEIVCSVPRDCFWPVPKVDSAVIKISREQLVTDRELNSELFFKVVKAGFANRRKLLSKNLLPLVGKNKASELAKIFGKLDLKPTARAQELSVEQWQCLSTALLSAIVL